jgi:hypothetical protein
MAAIAKDIWLSRESERRKNPSLVTNNCSLHREKLTGKNVDGGVLTNVQIER